MVHALEEAWRVLRPDGLLLDLRPALVHRTVALATPSGPVRMGTMRERFDDDVAANRAVGIALRRGLFRRAARRRVPCDRVIDTLEEFRAWLDDYASLDKLPSHGWLVRKIERALIDRDGPVRIVVSGPLDLQVLAKR